MQHNPVPSSDAAFKRMKAAKSKDTLPEVKLRSSLEKLGIAFEINKKPIPNLHRSVDILLSEKKIALFVDGCFWHGCPEHGTWPKQNPEFWREKILKNQARDKETNEILFNEGWIVIRIWEHENMDVIAETLSRKFLLVS